jgi:FkbM family methyltransferase
MFVDTYRFAMEPERIAALRRSALASLAHGVLHPADARLYLSDWRALIAGYAALDDAESRRIFRALLIYRACPRLSPVARNKPLADALNAFMRADHPHAPLGETISILGEPVARYRVAYNDLPFEIATIKYGLYWTLVSQQYYFRRGGVYVGPSPGDTILDGGSCLGDTAVKLAAHAGPTGRVYGFDPFPPHVSIARDVVLRNALQDRVKVFCCGLSDETEPDVRSALSDSAPHAPNAVRPGRPLELTDARVRIDDFCRAEGLNRVDYIKMDIEGSEQAALDGASDTIARHRPKLAICLYHKPADLWSIPATLKRRYPFYRLYLDHYSLHSEETVLYAIA